MCRSLRPLRCDLTEAASGSNAIVENNFSQIIACVSDPSGVDSEIYCQSSAGGPKSGTSTGVLLERIRYTTYTGSAVVPYYFPNWVYSEPERTTAAPSAPWCTGLLPLEDILCIFEDDKRYISRDGGHLVSDVIHPPSPQHETNLYIPSNPSSSSTLARRRLGSLRLPGSSLP